MAIYHLNVASVGIKTQKSPGTAGAHARYIMREQACSKILAHHMPDDGNAARRWLNHEENHNTRANGRVISKIRVALPIELDQAQRVAAIRDFMEQLTDGNRVPWAAAFHDQEGNDLANPHVHIIVRDLEIEPERGKKAQRVVMLSANKAQCLKAGKGPNPVEWTRQLWEETGNRHLEMAGHEPVLDRRTLAAQNVDRLPQIHEGRAAQAMEKDGQTPESKDRTASTALNGAAKLPEAYRREDIHSRQVNYASEIDQGLTRSQYNDQVRRENALRAYRAQVVERRDQEQQLRQDRRELWERLGLQMDTAPIERFEDAAQPELPDPPAPVTPEFQRQAQPPELPDLSADFAAAWPAPEPEPVEAPELEIEEPENAPDDPGAAPTPPPPVARDFERAAPPDPAQPQEHRPEPEQRPDEPEWRADLKRAAKMARERRERQRDRDRDDDREPPRLPPAFLIRRRPAHRQGTRAPSHRPRAF